VSSCVSWLPTARLNHNRMKGSLNIGTSWPFLCLHPFPLITERAALLNKIKVPWQEGDITQAHALNTESCECSSGSVSHS